MSIHISPANIPKVYYMYSTSIKQQNAVIGSAAAGFLQAGCVPAPSCAGGTRVADSDTKVGHGEVRVGTSMRYRIRTLLANHDYKDLKAVPVSFCAMRSFPRS